MDWTHLREKKYSTERPPTDWPTGVRPISLEGLSLLGIGPDNRLYWDGQPLKIERTISLDGWQTLLASVTAFGIAAGGFAALITALKIF
jgi:hypothetical protein